MIEHRWHILYYEHVPLWLWPAVFWQLWEIDRWSAHFGRRVFVEVEPDGKVYSVWWEGMHDRWDEDTHEKLTWSPGDLAPYLPNRLATALSRSQAQSIQWIDCWPAANHAQPEGLSRNLLRPPCAKRLRCAQLDWVAGVQTQTSACEGRLALGTPPPVPIPRRHCAPLKSVFVTRAEALRASVSKRVPRLPRMNQVQDCSLQL